MRGVQSMAACARGYTTLHWIQACAGVCVPYFVTCGIVVVLGSSLCEEVLRSLLFTRIGLRLLQPPLPVAK